MNGRCYEDILHVAMQDALSTAFAFEDIIEASIVFRNCSASFFKRYKGASEENVSLVYIREKTVLGLAPGLKSPRLLSGYPPHAHERGHKRSKQTQLQFSFDRSYKGCNGGGAVIGGREACIHCCMQSKVIKTPLLVAVGATL